MDLSGVVHGGDSATPPDTSSPEIRVASRSMTERFGDRATFAVEIDGVATPGLRVVDLWAAGRRLTVDDNAAYVPSLVFYMRADAERVRQGRVPACPFPGRGPAEIFELVYAD